MSEEHEAIIEGNPFLEVEAQLTLLQSRVKGLEAALRPFVNYIATADKDDGRWPDDTSLGILHKAHQRSITYGDLRRAKALYLQGCLGDRVSDTDLMVEPEAIDKYLEVEARGRREGAEAAAKVADGYRAKSSASPHTITVAGWIAEDIRALYGGEGRAPDKDDGLDREKDSEDRAGAREVLEHAAKVQWHLPIQRAISEIPVNNRAYISAMPETLRNVISHQLLETIADTAAKVVVIHLNEVAETYRPRELASGPSHALTRGRREGAEAAAKVADDLYNERGDVIAQHIRALYPAASSEDTTPTAHDPPQPDRASPSRLPNRQGSEMTRPLPLADDRRWDHTCL